MPDPLATLAERKAAAQSLLADFEAKVTKLTEDMLGGRLSLADWHYRMREELRRENALMLVAGAGGDKSLVDPNDWLKLGSELRHQYSYLEDFAHQLQDNDPRALAMAVGRTRLYARSTQASFWRQAMPVDLPAHPGDGSSECLTNCDCEWVVDYETDEDGRVNAVLATWQLGTVEKHCLTCVERAAEWSPLRIPVNVDDDYDSDYKSVAVWTNTTTKT